MRRKKWLKEKRNEYQAIKKMRLKQGREIIKNRKYQIEINMKMNMNHSRRNKWNQIIEVKCLC